jgi:hypothetical protein
MADAISSGTPSKRRPRNNVRVQPNKNQVAELMCVDDWAAAPVLDSTRDYTHHAGEGGFRRSLFSSRSYWCNGATCVLLAAPVSAQVRRGS